MLQCTLVITFHVQLTARIHSKCLNQLPPKTLPSDSSSIICPLVSFVVRTYSFGSSTEPAWQKSIMLINSLNSFSKSETILDHRKQFRIYAGMQEESNLKNLDQVPKKRSER